eukprot:INCI1682.1.p1 GENE.INCI1682.1~~INCI1682.1.p1  ORF type:complete len:834 (+),score=153.01 INCI1682.1:199-2502(+)
MSGVQLPNLPGFVSNKKRAGPKRQTLKFGPGGAAVSSASGPEGDEPMFFGGGKKEWDPSVTKSRAREAAARSAVVNEMASGRSELATWHTLSLRAYWKEELPSGNYPYRIRNLLILYYTDDNTMEVREKKTANAGLPQGTFVKKHKVPKGKDGFITARDLVPGRSISVYGRQFHILGCNDDITRDQLSALGVDVSFEGTAPPSPEDEAAKRYKGGNTAANREFKDYNETMLGGNAVSVRKLGAFLDFGNVPPLKFSAVWRDERMYGDLNKYSVNFFLEDRTFVIYDDVHGNEGKGPFTTSLKRQKIPKNYKVDASSIGHQSETYYDVLDLYVGNTLKVHGKELLIVDAVETTRQFYADQARRNASFRPQPQALQLEDPDAEAAAARPKQEPVPYLGGVVTFGSEESSLQSCLSLHPKKPRQDAEKVKSNQAASLKFSADLVSSKPEDFGRRFVVSFFLFDDTVSVFEDGRKNSGIVPGKFLKRQRLRNAKGEYFSSKDFFVGAQVRINDYTFVLDGLDAFSLNYAIHHPDQFAWANLEKIIGEIQERIAPSTRFGDSIIVGTSRDDTVIPEADFEEFLGSFLSKPEISSAWSFFYPEFNPLTVGSLRAFLTLGPEHFKELIASDTLATVVADAKLPADRRATKKSIQKIRHGFAHAQVSFQGIVDYYKNEHGNVSRKNFEKAMQEAKYISNVPIQPYDISALVEYFFPPGANNVSVNKLYQFLFERKQVRRVVDNRVTSTALHNGVAIKIQDKTSAYSGPSRGHKLH